MRTKFLKLLFILLFLPLTCAADWGDDSYLMILAKNKFPAGLTFYANYNDGSINADRSNGSNIGTFTRTTSATNPATYVDSSGVIQLVTTSNIPRFQGGYYDATGFHAQKGWMVEGARTNLLTRTDGTASGSGLWTGWTNIGSRTGTPVNTNNAISELTSISGATSQRVQYTGVAGDTGTKDIQLSSPNTSSASISNNNVVTMSCWAKSQTGFSGIGSFYLNINPRDDNGKLINNAGYNGSNIIPNLTTSWRKFSLTATVTDKTATISSIIGAAGTVTVITSAAQAIPDGAKITISGTTNFNGTYTITVVNTTTFTYSSAVVASESAGTVTQAISMVNAKLLTDTSISNTDTVDFEIYGAQIEVAPFASSFIPTTTAALTRNAEVLTYPTLNNRTAAQETIFIKFAPRSDFANDGGTRILLDDNGNRRAIYKSAVSTKPQFDTNIASSPSVTKTATTIPLANTSYVICGVTKHSSPYIQIYTNGISEGTYTTGDYTTPNLGSLFYIGARFSGESQLFGIIQAVLCFSRGLSSSENLSVSNILAQN